MADVLVVEDDAAIMRLLGLVLDSLGHDIRSADNAEDALLRSLEARPDLLLLDIGLPGRDGDELLSLLTRGIGPPRSLVIVSALPADVVRRVAEQHDALWLTKPFDVEELEEVVGAALAKVAARDEGTVSDSEAAGQRIADALRRGRLGED